jgi:hypothetical protein
VRLESGATGRQPGDRATITFDLDADLTDVFDWNVKQLFVYITITYQTNKRVCVCCVVVLIASSLLLSIHLLHPFTFISSHLCC